MRAFLIIVTLAAEAFAIGKRGPHVPAEKREIETGVTLGTFAQLIDHSNPSLGTFNQRFWFNYNWWNGTGSPIVLLAPDHQDGTGLSGFLQNGTIMGDLTQELGGASIILEHRYWYVQDGLHPREKWQNHVSTLVSMRECLSLSSSPNDLTLGATGETPARSRT